ncbi:putative glycerol kinase [Aphelenchoides bicaudatus]|nr:putative glycerol kinase [Aphelenchoides bicaudatus]
MVLLGAIDQGTSSSRFLVFDSASGDLVSSHQVHIFSSVRDKNNIEVKQEFPAPGFVEMDPVAIYQTCIECVEKACANLEAMGISKDEIKSIGIANQRETTVVWDKETGKPLYNAFGLDRDYFKAKTGLPIHPYFSALKLKWLLKNVPEVQEAKENGTLMFGTVDTWLIWNLTGGVRGGKHITDVTNASRTLLLDLHKRKWSSELCNFFGIPYDILPEILSSAEVYGCMKDGALKGVPISGCLGDQQAAMVGHNCLKIGDTKSTYGTGTFLLCNSGVKPILSKNGLLTTVGFQLGRDAPVCFALEGSGSIGGNVIRFLRDNLGFIKDSSEVEALAASVEDTEDVVFVPCFTGLFAPYWDSTARGTICGLTQCVTKAHIARAALKAVTLQTSEIIEAVEHDLDGEIKIHTIKVDGGMTANKLFNQMQADTLGRPIVCSKMAEISGLGAAIAGGIGAGLLSMHEFSESDSPKIVRYEPKLDDETRIAELKRWKSTVKRAMNWTSH